MEPHMGNATEDGALGAGDAGRKKKGGERNQFANHYKTRLCKSFTSGEPCMYGDRCRFAHGEAQLRTYIQNQRDGLTSEEAVQKFVLAGGLSASVRKRADELARQAAMSAGSTGVPLTQPTASVAGPAPIGGFENGNGASSFALTASDTAALSASAPATQPAASSPIAKAVSPLPQTSAVGGGVMAGGVLAPFVVLPGDVVDPSIVPPFTVINGHPIGKDGRVLDVDSLSVEELSYYYKEAMREQFKDVIKKQNDGLGGPAAVMGSAEGNIRSGDVSCELKQSSSGTLQGGNGVSGRSSPSLPSSAARATRGALDPNATGFTPGAGWGTLPAAPPSSGKRKKGAKAGPAAGTSPSMTKRASSGALQLKQQHVKNYFKTLVRECYDSILAAEKTNGEEDSSEVADVLEVSSSKSGQSIGQTDRAHEAPRGEALGGGGGVADAAPSVAQEKTAGTAAPSNNGASGSKRAKTSSTEAPTATPKVASRRAINLCALLGSKTRDPEDPKLMLEFYKSMAMASQEMVRDIEDAYPDVRSTLWPAPLADTTIATTASGVAAALNPSTAPAAPLLPMQASSSRQPTPPSSSPLTTAAAAHMANPNNFYLTQQQQQQLMLLQHRQQQQQPQMAANFYGGLPFMPASSMGTPLSTASPLTGGAGSIGVPATFPAPSPTQTPATTPAHLLGASADFSMPLHNAAAGAQMLFSPQQLQQLQQLQAQQAMMISPMMGLPFAAQFPHATAPAAPANVPATAATREGPVEALHKHEDSQRGAHTFNADPGLFRDTFDASNDDDSESESEEEEEEGSNEGVGLGSIKDHAHNAGPSPGSAPGSRTHRRKHMSVGGIPLDILNSLQRELEEDELETDG